VIGVGGSLRHARLHSARHDSALVDSLFAALKSVPVPQRVTASDATQATLGDCGPCISILNDFTKRRHLRRSADVW
jgi:hypothetical protein